MRPARYFSIIQLSNSREEPCYFGKLGKAVKKLKYGRWGRWGELITEIDGQEAGGHL